jgi:hypothetical protein
MLTTAAAFAFAMVRNVVASMGPLRGALLIDGTPTDCADDAGVRSRREVMTTPTAMPATRVRTR